jgi:hypothetical protein
MLRKTWIAAHTFCMPTQMTALAYSAARLCAGVRACVWVCDRQKQEGRKGGGGGVRCKYLAVRSFEPTAIHCESELQSKHVTSSEQTPYVRWSWIGVMVLTNPGARHTCRKKKSSKIMNNIKQHTPYVSWIGVMVLTNPGGRHTCRQNRNSKIMHMITQYKRSHRKCMYAGLGSWSC